MKINKEFKKKTIITAGVLAVSALAVIGGSTFAKYFTKIEGSGNAEIAKWSFRANNTSTVMEKIQLFANSFISNNILLFVIGIFILIFIIELIRRYLL